MRTTQKSHKTHQAHCKIHLPVSLTPASAHQRALEHFWTTMPERMLEIASRGRIVLHHVDTTLKHKNPKRYAEWRPEDLVPLEKCEHISMHNSHPHSKAHNARISAGIRRAHEERAGTIIIGISPEGYPSFFENASAAAATIGVSRQWANQCLRDGWRCAGWKLMLFSGSAEDFKAVKQEVAE